jgi:hypothetical protein
MNGTRQVAGWALAALALAFTPGCDTGSGALTGAGVGAGVGALAGSGSGHAGEGAIIGALVGGATGAAIGTINAQQREQLQQSPQGQHALYTVQNNNYYYTGQPPPPPPPGYAPSPPPYAPPPSSPTATPAQPVAPVAALAPVTVDDIKALTAAGVKPAVIIDEINQAHTVYTAQDIAAAQQANIDPSVIQRMEQSSAN